MKYRTIVADPPWPGSWFPEGIGGRRRNATPAEYRLMDLSDIEALPVSTLAATDAALFLWVPAQLNREGIGVCVARAWGFEPVSEIVWDKPNPGMGVFPRMCHEIMLVCRRGDHAFEGRRDVRSVQRWHQRYDKNHGKRHSAKPEGAIDLIEQYSPGPYVELFARRHRLGWDVWGNESANTATLDVPTPSTALPPEARVAIARLRESIQEVPSAQLTHGHCADTSGSTDTRSPASTASPAIGAGAS